jgi:AbiV family abortive infection protein
VKRPSGFAPYCGSLTPQQAASGTAAALSNAQDLFRAAHALFEVCLFAQSAALAILAIEEAEKVFILLDLLVAVSDREIELLWSQYRRHSPKQRRFSKWIQLMAQRQKEPLAGTKELEKSLADPQLGESFIELKKQLSLYTDNFQGSGWSLPAKRVTPEEASKALACAGLAIAHNTLYSGDELTIWKKHLVGIDEKNRVDKRTALLNFARELDEKGFQRPNWFDHMLDSA